MSDSVTLKMLAQLTARVEVLEEVIQARTPPEQTPWPPRRLAPPVPEEDPISDDEDAVLGVLSADPITAKQIASRTGRQYNSRLRTILCDMVRKKLIIRGADGYHDPAAR